MTWRRHTGDSKFHAGAELAHSFATFCSGRWSLADEARGDVEHHPSPHHEDRCEACQRQVIEVRRVELAMREFVDSAPYPTFELGGEA